MGEIKVQFSVLDDLSGRKRSMSTKAGDIRRRLDSLRRSLDWEVARSYSIDRNLSDICREIEGHTEALLGMSQYLENASRDYRECENKIANDGLGENSNSSFMEAAESFVTQWLPLVMDYGWLPALLTNPAVSFLLKDPYVWQNFGKYFGDEARNGTAGGYIYNGRVENKNDIYKYRGNLYNPRVYASAYREAKAINPAIKIAGQTWFSAAEDSSRAAEGTGNTGTGNPITSINNTATVTNKTAAVIANTAVKTSSSTWGRIVNGLSDFFLPTTTEDMKAVQLAEKALDSGAKGVKSLTGASTVSAGREILAGASIAGKVGKAAGVVGTIITPFTEIGTSTDLFKDDLALIAEYDPDNYNKALALATVASTADACSYGFARSIANTIPSLVQLLPGEDPQWTDTWINNVNGAVNAKSVSEHVFSPAWNAATNIFK